MIRLLVKLINFYRKGYVDGGITFEYILQGNYGYKKNSNVIIFNCIHLSHYKFI